MVSWSEWGPVVFGIFMALAAGSVLARILWWCLDRISAFWSRRRKASTDLDLSFLTNRLPPEDDPLVNQFWIALDTLHQKRVDSLRSAMDCDYFSLVIKNQQYEINAHSRRGKDFILGAEMAIQALEELPLQPQADKDVRAK